MSFSLTMLKTRRLLRHCPSVSKICQRIAYWYLKVLASVFGPRLKRERNSVHRQRSALRPRFDTRAFLSNYPTIKTNKTGTRNISNSNTIKNQTIFSDSGKLNRLFLMDSISQKWPNANAAFMPFPEQKKRIAIQDQKKDSAPTETRTAQRLDQIFHKQRPHAVTNENFASSRTKAQPQRKILQRRHIE